MPTYKSKGAAITGWGKCLPPAVLTNADIATFLDTSDEWITTRTGIRERRVSHVPLGELMYVAAARALACAGLDGRQDRAHRLRHHQLRRPGAERRLRHPAAHRRRGLRGHGREHRLHQLPLLPIYRHGDDQAPASCSNALVIGAEVISPFIDWSDRNIAVLFGDGAAAVVLQATDRRGRPARRAARLLRRVARDPARARHGRAPTRTRTASSARPSGSSKARRSSRRPCTAWRMACEEALAKIGKTADDVDLVIPHQANLRIIEVGGEEGRRADGARVHQRASLRQHVRGHRAGRAVRSARGRPREARRAAADAVVRRRAHVHRATWCAGASA